MEICLIPISQAGHLARGILSKIKPRAKAKPGTGVKLGAGQSRIELHSNSRPNAINQKGTNTNITDLIFKNILKR